MQSREALTLIGALGLFAAIGLWFVGKESLAEEVPPDAAPTVTEPARSTPTGDVPRESHVVPRDHVQIEEAFGKRDGKPVDAVVATTGTIKGDVQLAVSALDRITSITIHVEEARRPVDDGGQYFAPRRFTVPAKMGPGTPTFEVTGIPFSTYPWVVSAYAPGLNGTRRTLVIDEQNPVVDDVVLTITPGGPFSVLLRDQDMAPYPGVDVRLQPTGEPAGRAAKAGVSDNFGGVVFEDVLAGEYQIHVSQGGQPLLEPSKVSVQPGAALVSARIQGQGHTVTIPRGVALQLRIADVNGYGLGDVQASATATDTRKVKVLEKSSDHGGNLEFPYLTPGVWQIDVYKNDFQRGTRMVTIKAGEVPELMEFQLVRLR